MTNPFLELIKKVKLKINNSEISNSNDQLKDDQNLDYSYSSQVKLLVNNEKYSDVSFSVGEEEQLIYAHKMILASGSPVMENMFYSDPAEKEYPIRILDLTPNGFINMLRYMYGYEIDFDLSVLYDVYKAADKYSVHNLTNKILEYIKSKLNVSNCCLIYDQLLKLKNYGDLFKQVSTLIENETNDAFSSECFKQISRECLIDILKYIQYLSIDEIDILRSCLNWIEAELIRNNLSSTVENKRSIFNEIKPFIRFSRITIQQLTDFKEIDSLLNSEEVGNLFLHLTDNKTPNPFKCKTRRKILFMVIPLNFNFILREQISEKSILLTTNQEIDIEIISTEFKSSVSNLVLNIYNDKDQLIDVKPKKELSSYNYWRFHLDYFKVIPNVIYRFSFKFDSHKFNQYFSDKSKFDSYRAIGCFNKKYKFIANDNNKLIINLNFEKFHCIRSIYYHPNYF